MTLQFGGLMFKTTPLLLLLWISLGECGYKPYGYFRRSQPYSFTSMSDIDWAKRGGNQAWRRQIYSYWPGSQQSHFAGMSDIDWGKRSSAYDWINDDSYSFGMGDQDWGWKKRSAPAAPALSDIEDNEEETKSDCQDSQTEDDDVDEPTTDDLDEFPRASRSSSPMFRDNTYFHKFRRNDGGFNYVPSFAYRPFKPIRKAASPTRSFTSKLSSASPSNGYSASASKTGGGYSSMADMDWGWKKKKRSLASLRGHNKLWNRY